MAALLEAEHLAAGYGPAEVLFDINLRVGEGEVVTLLGRNGMGKTTTIRVLMGLLQPRGGTARFAGASLVGLPPYRIAQLGLGLVPEGRQIFPTLTVEENLIATAAARFGAPRWQLPAVYRFFPALAERRANMGNEISGGEQQMLAIGRALMTNPDLLLMDEPTEGLAPLIVREVGRVIAELKREGLSILLVEQNLPMAASVADRVHVLTRGEIVYSGRPGELLANEDVKSRFLGVA
jgi:branched-chain amino acid transport system ATP-binding protein